MRVKIEATIGIEVRDGDHTRCLISCPKYAIGETAPLSNTKEADYCNQFGRYIENYKRCEECLKAKEVNNV